MVRDTIQNQEYFIQYINYETTRIEKFEAILENIPLCETDRIAQCKGYIAGFLKNKYIAMYSNGENINKIRASFIEYSQYIIAIGLSSYADVVDFLAMVILMDYKEKNVMTIIEKVDINDALIDILITYIKWGHMESNEEKLLFPAQYGVFYQCLKDNTEYISTLLEYTEHKWYESNSDMPWYNSHEKDTNTYYGYWCWLAAAIIKMKTTTNDYHCKFLPYDLI